MLIIEIIYVLVVNNGICLQWFLTRSLETWGILTVTFPISFSTKVLCVQATNRRYTESSFTSSNLAEYLRVHTGDSVINVTTTSIGVQKYYAVYCLAIGY